MNLTKFNRRQKQSYFELPFEIRTASALGISVIADALDYVGAPIFALPIIGDIADIIIMSLLYRMTKSKASAVINTIEFIPFIGDFVPIYTISTLLWIFNESRNRNRVNQKHEKTKEASTIMLNGSKSDMMASSLYGKLPTRTWRTYAILKSKRFG